jgi:chromate transporter
MIRPDFGEAFRFWLKLGFLSFGGVAGQLALMQHELVDRRRWVAQRPFLNALNFCMLLPGPEAQQLATYLGWKLHGVRGGLAAGLLFILPGAAILLALSWLAAAHGDVGWVGALFDGVKPVVLGIVAAAIWRMGRKTLTGWPALALAVGAFIGLRLAGVPFPLLILAAGLVGVTAIALGRDPFGVKTAAPGDLPPLPARGFVRLAGLVALFAVLWAVPVLGVFAWLGTDPYGDVAELFTTAAFVTFGGAYAVLPYIADAGVNTYGWLTTAEMVKGLALAESTPGPTILVLQFVGFFAGWTNPGAVSPLLAGTVASLLALYVTFLPSFLFIFAGGPYVERIIANRYAAAALAAITAAVVGVILNLGVFLGTAIILPAPGVIAWDAVILALLSLAALIRFGVQVHWLVLAGAAIGLARAAVMGGL